MNWYSKLFKLASPYGYWLDPNGKAIPVVQYQGHVETGEEILEGLGFSRDQLPSWGEVYQQLFDRNYIRITKQSVFYVETQHPATNAQVKSIKRLIEDLEFTGQIVVNENILRDISQLGPALNPSIRQPKLRPVMQESSAYIG